MVSHEQKDLVRLKESPFCDISKSFATNDYKAVV